VFFHPNRDENHLSVGGTRTHGPISNIQPSNSGVQRQWLLPIVTYFFVTRVGQRQKKKHMFDDHQ